jgi:hypothetical protein
VILVWGYVGWRHARGWNAELQDGRANYFRSFKSGILSTLYVIWLNILISLPVLGIIALLEEDFHLQLRTGALHVLGLFLIGLAWFWVGRRLFFPRCETTFGGPELLQASRHKNVIRETTPGSLLDNAGPPETSGAGAVTGEGTIERTPLLQLAAEASRLGEYPLLYTYFDDFNEIRQAWQQGRCEVARHQSDCRSRGLSVNEIITNEDLFLELYGNGLAWIRFTDGIALRRDLEKFYWHWAVHPEERVSTEIKRVVKAMRLRYGLIQ